MSTAAETWPQANAQLREKASTGKLTEKQRQNAEWLGFDLPTYQPRTDYGLYAPAPAPVTTAEDLNALAGGATGVATAAQVYELPIGNALRHAYDTPDRSYCCKHYTIWAAGRAWHLHGNPFSKYASLSERTAANAARRVQLEQARVAKANAAAVLPPLTALLYGPAPVAAPRYTTPEAANRHELRRRQEWLTHMRGVWAAGIWKVRRRLAELDEATIARYYTEWQRRGYGCYAYLLDFIWQKQKGKVAA